MRISPPGAGNSTDLPPFRPGGGGDLFHLRRRPPNPFFKLCNAWLRSRRDDRNRPTKTHLITTLRHMRACCLRGLSGPANATNEQWAPVCMYDDQGRLLGFHIFRENTNSTHKTIDDGGGNANWDYYYIIGIRPCTKLLLG